MDHIWPAGRLRIIRLNTEGLYLNLVPDDGFKWRILAAWCLHDDAVVRTLWWELYSAVDGTLLRTTSGAVAAGVNWPISMNGGAAGAVGGSPNDFIGPLLADQFSYPVAKVDALTATKKLSARALVLEMSA